MSSRIRKRWFETRLWGFLSGQLVRKITFQVLGWAAPPHGCNGCQHVSHNCFIVWQREKGRKWRGKKTNNEVWGKKQSAQSRDRIKAFQPQLASFLALIKKQWQKKKLLFLPTQNDPHAPLYLTTFSHGMKPNIPKKHRLGRVSYFKKKAQASKAFWIVCYCLMNVFCVLKVFTLS